MKPKTDTKTEEEKVNRATRKDTTIRTYHIMRTDRTLFLIFLGISHGLLVRMFLIALVNVFIDEKQAKQNENDEDIDDQIQPFQPQMAHFKAGFRLQIRMHVHRHNKDELQQLTGGDERSCPTQRVSVVHVHDSVHQAVDQGEATRWEVMCHSGQGESGHVMERMQEDNRFAGEHQPISIGPFPQLGNQEHKVRETIQTIHRSQTTGHVSPGVHATIDNDRIAQSQKHPSRDQRQRNVMYIFH